MSESEVREGARKPEAPEPQTEVPETEEPDEAERRGAETEGAEAGEGDTRKDRPRDDEDDEDPGLSDQTRARLGKLRDKIVALDEDLIRLVGERRDLVLEIGRIKEELGLPILDPGREAQVVRRAAELSRRLGVDEELTRDVIWRIMASAREAQEGERGWGPPDYPPPGSSAAASASPASSASSPDSPDTSDSSDD